MLIVVGGISNIRDPPHRTDVPPPQGAPVLPKTQFYLPETQQEPTQFFLNHDLLFSPVRYH